MRVLFVSWDNARRGLIAEALLRFLLPGVEVASAGIAPAERVDPFTIAVLRERHIPLPDRRPMALTPEMVRGADVVVSLGALEPSPLLPPGTAIEWEVADLAGQPLDAYRHARAAIENLVFNLIDDLETFRRLQLRRRGTADPFASYFPGR